MMENCLLCNDKILIHDIPALEQAIKFRGKKICLNCASGISEAYHDKMGCDD